MSDDEKEIGDETAEEELTLEEQEGEPMLASDDDDDGDSSITLGGDGSNLKALYQVPVNVSAVLGKTTMQVNQLLKLGRGAVVELDRKVGDAIDIYVNDRLVARGEVIIVDEHLGVTLTEIIKSEQAA